jgi:hypothetical protein
MAAIFFHKLTIDSFGQIAVGDVITKDGMNFIVLALHADTLMVKLTAASQSYVDYLGKTASEFWGELK